MSQERINAAVKATDSIAEAFATIQAAMTHGFEVNGYGVLRNTWTALLPLTKATQQAQSALATIQTTEWPTEADYAAM